MQPEASIIIASYNRKNLFKRCLYSIAARGPSIPYEVVVVDDGSVDDIEGLLRKFTVNFPWKLVKFDAAAYEAKTGLKKFFNNPSVTYNIGFKQCSPTSDKIFLMGNEVIAWGNAFDKLIDDAPKNNEPYIVFSTTYDTPQEVLDKIDAYGQHLDQVLIDKYCKPFPLQDLGYKSEVVNYLSLSSRGTWEQIGGFDERYYAGIACEDSDFVRRIRRCPYGKLIWSEGITLHQYHGGMTRYYQPLPANITMDRWNEGLAINRAVFAQWDEKSKLKKVFDHEFGTLGVGKVVTNVDS